jgi:diaminobutyrate-2-oxoglutarate transaminase
MNVIEALESGNRYYSRVFPVVFDKALGCRIWTPEGRSYLDFFAGAGALNYGHNHPALKQALIEYLTRDGIVHALDMATTAKQAFMAGVQRILLAPRAMSYRQLFPGPTGANAVEVALKLARKATGRTRIVAFTNAFHGQTLGALAVTGNAFNREGAGQPLDGASFVPYDGYLGPHTDTAEQLARLLDDPGSGLDKPAAVLVEVVQGEGGCRAASDGWMRRLRQICDAHALLLIVDDVQAGCGRTGPFFSFEPAGIEPDIICLSKSISGMGLPMAMVLVKEEFDVLLPGQHSGTFRGNNAAFVTGLAALELFWSTDALSQQVQVHAARVRQRLETWQARWPDSLTECRGRGLLQGLVFARPQAAAEVRRTAFAQGLIIEGAGSRDEVLKILCPLTISVQELDEGLAILESALCAVVGK